MVSSLQQVDDALKVIPEQHNEFLTHKDLIEKILQLQEEKNVLILGHNYMEPLVYQLSGERERGDSLALSRHAAKSDKPIILFDGVFFMAETAKILSPDKKVLIADLTAGCSLAEPFNGEDVCEYKRRFPGAPVVTYVNSLSDVKAESDYCCTSANGDKVILHAAKAFNTDRVIFLPDSLMGANLDNELKPYDIDVIYPGKYDEKYGKCEVHEQFTREQLLEIRKQYNMPKGSEKNAILVHWECPAEVLEESDFYGSTSQMSKYIKDHPNLKRVYLATECEMAANLASEYPEVEFIRTCRVSCQHMRKITLEKILYSLEHEVYEVTVPEEIAKKARTAIDRMLEVI